METGVLAAGLGAVLDGRWSRNPDHAQWYSWWPELAAPWEYAQPAVRTPAASV